MAHAIIVIAIALLEYVHKKSSREIDPFAGRVICHVIDHRGGGQAADHLSGFGVEHNEFARITRSDEKTMSTLIQSDGSRLLCLLRDRPGREQSAFVAIKHFDRVVTRGR